MSKSPEPKPASTKQPSARQLREQKRAAEERRRRMIYIGAGVGGVIVLLVIVYLTTLAPRPPSIEGVQVLTNYPAGQHAEGPIGYNENPLFGGPHNPDWQNCGIYDRAVQSEYAVHSLEHGAVWITYDPSLPADQLETLRNLTRANQHVLLSPYAGLPSPVVASGWAVQLRLQNANDPRLAEFVAQYQNGGFTPERGAPCVGGTGTPL